MKKFFKNYINNNIKLEMYQKIGILFLVFVIAGIFGWIYEYIFYFLNSGMKVFYWRGGNFLPWINIYATGALMIIFLTRKLKKHPFLIFLVAVIATGILEYFSGLVIYKFYDGLRLWDYNTEILSFGNIGGFVCLRSVLFFGFSALILMYLIVPFCIYLSKIMNKKLFITITVLLFSIFLFDELYNLLFARWYHLPRASSVYKKIGFKYMKY